MAKAVSHQPSPKVLACIANGRKGGLARAKNNSKKKIKEWASKGGTETANNHGDLFFSFIAKKRKTVGRYRKAVVTKTKKAA